MIQFKKLRWKNFLSTGDTFTEIELDKHPTSLIIGENGSGKSTMLDALTFVLFSKPFRRVNKTQMINTVNGKGCLTEVEFTIGNKSYLVRRGQKPSIFEIYVGDELINQDAKVKDYQERLEKHILKLNYKSFTQIIVLGSSSFQPFMQLPAFHRREVIEDLLDIQIFSIMNQILKERITDNKDELFVNDQTLDLNSEKIEIQRKYIKEVKEINNDKITKTKESIRESQEEAGSYKRDIELNKTQTKELLGKVAGYDKLLEEIGSFQKVETKIKNSLDKVKDDIDFFDKHDDCPLCKQGIEKDHKFSIMTEKNKMIDEKEHGLQELNNKMIRMTVNRNSMESIKKTIDNLNSDSLNYGYKVDSIDDYVLKLQKEIDYLNEVKKRSYGDDEKLAQLKSDRDRLESKRKRLITDREYFHLASDLLKDTGIKTKIIKQYLPIMNKLINKHLTAMDSYFNFTLDENFNEQIKSRFRDEFSYDSFSEGEKMRIDLSLLYTCRAIAKMKNSANTNLLVLDEVFDSSLDTGGTDEFMKLLHSMGQGINIFVISHKGDVLSDKFENVVKFEKIGNFSKVV